MKRLLVPLIVIICTSGTVNAYEQATHATITRAAFFASDLGAGSFNSFTALQRSLGLNVVSPLGDGKTYFEFIGNLTGVSPYRRAPQPYERKVVKDLEADPDSNSPLIWLMFGAIREDDNPNETPPTPQDVEGGIRRPLHHFFDPYMNRPLVVPGLSEVDNDVRKNVDWGLGVKDSFTDPNAQESPRRNHFTVFDAREAMFRALTLMTASGNDYVGISEGADPALKQQWRQAYWATTFRALGDVLHLNQDMAQPQHTRNEAHSGTYCPGSRVCLTGHTSVYEKYINARALRQETFDSLSPFHEPVAISPLDLPLIGYPIPAFASYSNYWSTAPGDKQFQGSGLADYSNRGFFTAAKNFGNTEYLSPSSNPFDYVIESAFASKWDGSSFSDAMPTYVYYGNVHDSFQNKDIVHVPLTTYSFWDQFIKRSSGKRDYSLTRVNYDAMANLLIPRAVAYSAGLINYFFRGRIDIAPPYEGVFAVADHSKSNGFTTLRANVKNLTPAFSEPDGSRLSQTMHDGTFFAVLRYHKDKKYVDGLDTIVGISPCTNSAVLDPADPGASTQCRDGSEEIIVSKPLTGVSLGDEQTAVKFDFSSMPIPFGMTDVVLQVVYRGPMGNETDAVAVGTLDISEPTYFTYQNDTDYIRLGSEVHTRDEINADSSLLDLVWPQYCVDRGQSPAKLRDGCLLAEPIDLAVSFSDLVYPLATVTQLPVRRLFRLVYLSSADEAFDSPKEKVAARQKITIRSQRSGAKALMNHEGSCLPIEPFDVPARHAQLVVTAPGQGTYRVDSFGSLRGVNGWFNASCVTIGDDGSAGTPDDRARAMTPLFGDELVPYVVQIHPAYL